MEALVKIMVVQETRGRLKLSIFASIKSRRRRNLHQPFKTITLRLRTSTNRLKEIFSQTLSWR